MSSFETLTVPDNPVGHQSISADGSVVPVSESQTAPEGGDGDVSAVSLAQAEGTSNFADYSSIDAAIRPSSGINETLSPAESNVSCYASVQGSQSNANITEGGGISATMTPAAQVQERTWNVYVGDLPPNVTEAQIREAFAPCGEIKLVNIIREKNTGVCRGICFVHFGSAEAQKKALFPPFNFPIIGGKQARVKRSDAKKTLFIRNIPQEMNTEEITAALLELLYGITTNVQVTKGGLGNFRGACFAKFDSYETAEAAKKILMNANLRDKTLNVSWDETTNRFNEDSNSNVLTLYVSNLSPNVQEESLKALFAQYGEITKCVLVRKENRVFAFITYRDRDTCVMVTKALNNLEYEGQKIGVTFAKASSLLQSGRGRMHDMSGGGRGGKSHLGHSRGIDAPFTCRQDHFGVPNANRGIHYGQGHVYGSMAPPGWPSYAPAVVPPYYPIQHATPANIPSAATNAMGTKVMNGSAPYSRPTANNAAASQPQIQQTPGIYQSIPGYTYAPPMAGYGWGAYYPTPTTGSAQPDPPATAGSGNSATASGTASGYPPNYAGYPQYDYSMYYNSAYATHAQQQQQNATSNPATHRFNY